MAFIFKELFNQATITSIDNQLRFALSIPNQSGAYNITWENLKTLLGNLYNDVLSYDNLVAFPLVGDTNFIYIAKDSNLIYRWGGDSYIQIGGGDLSDYVTNEELTTILSDYALNSEIPTKTSDLTNDSGFITSSSIPDISGKYDKIGGVISGDVTVGSNAAGKNISILATLGSELAPAFAGNSGTNWTLSSSTGYTQPFAGTIEKTGNGTGNATPTAVTNLEIGETYLLTHVVTSISGGTMGVSFGGVTCTPIFTSGTFTELVYVLSTTKPIYTPSATELRIVFTTSWKKITALTGEINIQGALIANKIISTSRNRAITIRNNGNTIIGEPGTTDLQIPLFVGYNGSGDIAAFGRTDGAPSYMKFSNGSGIFVFDYIGGSGGFIWKIESAVKATLLENGFFGINATSQAFARLDLDDGNFQQNIGQFIYQSSTAGDAVGDTRFSNQSGIITFEYCTVANATKGAGTWVAYFKISIAGVPQFPMFNPAAEAVVTSNITGVLSVANLLQNTLVGKGTLINGQCTITDASITTNSLALVTMSTVGVSTSVPIKYTASNGSMLFSTGQGTDTCDFTYQIFV